MTAARGIIHSEMPQQSEGRIARLSSYGSIFRLGEKNEARRFIATFPRRDPAGVAAAGWV